MSFIDPDDIQERVVFYFHASCEESQFDLKERVLRRQKEIERTTGLGTVNVDGFWSSGTAGRRYYVLSMDARVYEEFSGNPRHIVADVF